MDKTNKRSRILIAAALLVVTGIIAISLISGTLAKYTETLDYSDSARVAKWDVSVGDGKTEFALFDTIYDTANDLEETDVAAGKIIAPGTYGKMDLVLNNDSEVNADYTVALSLTNTNNIPIQFYTDNTFTTPLASMGFNGTVAMNTSETETLYWRWEFEDGTEATDSADTALGTLAAGGGDVGVTVAADVTFTQVD